MIWDNYSNLKDKHAFLSPSKISWIRYDEETIAQKFYDGLAKTAGTYIHEFAAARIKKRRKLNKNGIYALEDWLYVQHNLSEEVIDIDYVYPNVQRYVNDAISFGMIPEKELTYIVNGRNDICFGHADAITFQKNTLYIFDLKTGKTEPNMEQLLIYAALFCLQYHFKPADILMELRLYTNEEIIAMNPMVDNVLPYQEGIIRASNCYYNLLTDKEI